MAIDKALSGMEEIDVEDVDNLLEGADDVMEGLDGMPDDSDNIIELDDGSVEIYLTDEDVNESLASAPFDANLAEFMSDDALAEIASELLEEVRPRHLALLCSASMASRIASRVRRLERRNPSIAKKTNSTAARLVKPSTTSPIIILMRTYTKGRLRRSAT